VRVGLRLVSVRVSRRSFSRVLFCRFLNVFRLPVQPTGPTRLLTTSSVRRLHDMEQSSASAVSTVISSAFVV
jgi:hypothetical protein